MPDSGDVTQAMDDNETKLKDRIAQCKNIIESLKCELNVEKAKLEKETKGQQLPYAQQPYETMSTHNTGYYTVSTSDNLLADFTYDSNMYSACVDSKLNCDENLMEYEKQLEKYQNTLNMAQIEKKNAIRKQMLAKAYRLKLLEVENQCNIELLRVKQSLQCLEPLQMIASKWQNEPDDASYNLDKFELMPRFPELSANVVSEVEEKEEIENKADAGSKNDSIASDLEDNDQK
ncbi:uncharacterized protein LOC126369886 [Pectinophora gossypiella]|uniref:uncharacterized protein LOC126369886 n=1 Tax=Pectinophora gossypiella TaxID=13191 RepID=UPI00214F1DD6|nr:uncharacterized protein LOC126369886 [Pectinophora gossypiella]